MTDRQQIEEMAKVIYDADILCDTCGDGTGSYCSDTIADLLVNAGYRKRSEWISVEERLPHVSGKYICGVKDKKGNTWTVPADWSLELKTWFGEFGEIKNIVTHWMPLPEAPKVDGGDE